jgi:hypothetical protein
MIQIPAGQRKRTLTQILWTLRNAAPFLLLAEHRNLSAVCVYNVGPENIHVDVHRVTLQGLGFGMTRGRSSRSSSHRRDKRRGGAVRGESRRCVWYRVQDDERA